MAFGARSAAGRLPVRCGPSGEGTPTTLEHVPSTAPRDPGPPGPGPHLPSPLQELDDARLRRHGVRLLLKRDDLIDPHTPGNNWRKLHLNLAAAREQGHTRLLTFGGAYSNHVRAVAAAGRRFGFSTVGVIRGEEHTPLNWSLARAVAHGMRLVYMDRTSYRSKHDPAVAARLRQELGGFYLLPEGGSNALAVRGCARVPGEVAEPFDVICCGCGTGGTLAGIAAGLGRGQRAIGFSALRGGGFLADEVLRLQTESGAVTGNWSVETRYHFGGFARSRPPLDAFVADFRARHGIDLERVYVAKMLAGLFDLVERAEIRSGATVVAVVTGGAEPGPLR